MYLYFNSNGQLLEKLNHGPLPVAGTTNFEIFAYFEGVDVDLKYTTASLTLFKPDLDGTSYPDLTMTPVSVQFVQAQGDPQPQKFANGVVYKGFRFDFSNYTQLQQAQILLDTHGLWKATIELIGTDQRTVYTQGQFNFNVSNGTEPEDETILSIETLLSNLRLTLASKLNVNSSAYLRVVSSFPASGQTFDSAAFNIGDILFNTTTRAFYTLDSLTVRADDPILGPNPKKIDLDLAGLKLPSAESIILANNKQIATTDDIKNPTITIKQGEAIKGTFTLNQSNDQTIQLSAGGGGGTGDFEELNNRPKYNGTTMSHLTDIPLVPNKIKSIQGATTGTEITPTGTMTHFYLNANMPMATAKSLLDSLSYNYAYVGEEIDCCVEFGLESTTPGEDPGVLDSSKAVLIVKTTGEEETPVSHFIRCGTRAIYVIPVDSEEFELQAGFYEVIGEEYSKLTGIVDLTAENMPWENGMSSFTSSGQTYQIGVNKSVLTGLFSFNNTFTTSSDSIALYNGNTEIPSQPDKVSFKNINNQSVLGSGNISVPTQADLDAKENTSNKVTSWQNSPDYTHYPSEKLVKDSIDEIREIAEGKVQAITVSNTDTLASIKTYLENVSTAKAYLENGTDITQSIKSGDTYLILNNLFTNDGTSSDYIMLDESGYLSVKKNNDYILYKADTNGLLSKKGNEILVIQTNVPDWWSDGWQIQGSTRGVKARLLETRKVDLSNYRTSAQQDVIDNGKQPLITSSNKLSPSLVNTDSSNRFVSDSEKTTWNGKQNELNSTNKLNPAYVNTDSSNRFVSDSEKSTWNGKSVVSVSDTGTATDEVQYIIINGVEKKLAGGGGSAEGAVKYNEAQTLTTEQKAQARSNIGASEVIFIDFGD